MEFQLSYWKPKKRVLLNCCTHYASQFGKLSNGHRTGKGQFSFQSQRRAMSRNVQIALISHASKVMLKIVQARLQQKMNQELPDVQAGFRKSIGTRDQIANIHWLIEKSKKFQKNTYFCFTDYAKAFNCVHHKKTVENPSGDGNIDHLTWLLRNLYAGQEATVRAEHGTADWFKIVKGICHGCILSPCLF